MQNNTDRKAESAYEILDGLDDVNFPLNSFKTELYPYQRIGASFILLAKKLILADACGLGKTVQFLAAFVYMKENGMANRALVVCPTSLVLQWRGMVERFTGLSCQVVKGIVDKRKAIYSEGWKADVTVISYDTFRMDGLTKSKTGKTTTVGGIFGEFEFDVVCLDEAVAIKNYKALTTKAVKGYIYKKSPEYVVLASATPMENNVLELYSLLSCLTWRFGKFIDFKNYYCVMKEEQCWRTRTKEEKVKMPDGSIKVHKKGSKCKQKYEKLVGYQNLDVLREQIKPFFLRRVWKDVFDQVPPFTEEDIWVELEPEARRKYEEYRAGFILELQDNKKVWHKMHVLQKLNCLLEVCDGIIEGSRAKINEIKRLIEEVIVNDKFVIFSRYRMATDNIIEPFLKEQGISYVRITGAEDKMEIREQNKIEFLEGQAQCCLITEAGELGLDLQSARYLIFYDLLWNPKRMEQVVGRVYRIGTEGCVVFHILVENSIEERIKEVLEKKEDLFDYMISGLENLSKEELMGFLLPKD